MSVVTSVVAWVVIGLFVFGVVWALAKKRAPGGSHEDPIPAYEDPDIGLMKWSKDHEAWIGTHAGLQFALSYERKAAPTPKLLAYAKEVLADSDWLLSTFEEQKKNWKVPPHVEAELAALRFGLVSFSMHKGQGYIFATVEGGGGNRCWRIEYRGRKCDGLGFDT